MSESPFEKIDQSGKELDARIGALRAEIEAQKAEITKQHSVLITSLDVEEQNPGVYNEIGKPDLGEKADRLSAGQRTLGLQLQTLASVQAKSAEERAARLTNTAKMLMAIGKKHGADDTQPTFDPDNPQEAALDLVIHAK